MDKKHTVVVLGCGVIGLTTGLVLLHEGHDVTILTKDIPPNTTSNAAGAFWYPCLEEPNASIRNQLSLATYAYVHKHILPTFKEEAACVERMIDVYYQTEDMAPHKDCEKGFQKFKVMESVPPQYGCIGGFSFQSYVVDTDVYLNFLYSKFIKEGGKVVTKDLTSKSDLIDELQKSKFDAVVNCSGLGSEKVFEDTTVFPVRGQTILVDPIPGYDRLVYIDTNEPTYILPRATDCVLGGTFQVGNANLNIDPEDTKKILERVSHFGVKDVAIKREKVGLRPGRPTVRLEADTINVTPKLTIPVVHNYGHGGRGFTLSWGCALRVSEMLKETFNNK